MNSLFSIIAAILLSGTLKGQSATRSLVWEAVGTNQTSFVIYNGTAVFAVVPYVPGTVTHKFTWTVTNGLYVFTCKARNEFGESAASNTVSLVALPPEATKNLNITNP